MRWLERGIRAAPQLDGRAAWDARREPGARRAGGPDRVTAAEGGGMLNSAFDPPGRTSSGARPAHGRRWPERAGVQPHHFTGRGA